MFLPRNPRRMATQPDLTHPVMVHFYRAVVSHMDVWRQRMDATTNWASATTAAMVTFSFSSSQTPHFVLLLALAFTGMFLLMESRRYQIFDLWRRRFRLLNRYLIEPVLSGETGNPRAEVGEALRLVGQDLGMLVPQLKLLEAAGYRIRRNYGYLFLIGIVAWLLKLEVHPVPATTLAEVVERAAIGGIPGVAITTGVAAGAVLGALLGILAPSERMNAWSDVPAPLTRWWQSAPAVPWRRGRGKGT
jgi:uncharacterized membrane protein